MLLLRKIPNIISQALLSLINNQNRNAFILSFLLGALFAVSLHLYNASTDNFRDTPMSGSYDWAYERWLYHLGFISKSQDPDLSRYQGRLRNESDKIYYEETEANFLRETINIHCLVLATSAETASSVKDTWGKHCNSLSFFSEKIQNNTVPVNKLPSKSAFGLLCKSFHEILSKDDNFDWVLVTSDNTFAIPENLRYYVAPWNSSQALYLGHAMKFWSQVYNWGQAGYTLSRAALLLITNKFSKEKCDSGGKYWKNGDWYLGKHLAQLGVEARDTRDHLGKSRFNGYSFKKLLFPGGVSLFERYWRDSIYLSPDGPKCCSNYAITFNGLMSRSKMHQLEYLFYHLRPFPHGGKIGNVAPPPPPANPYLTEEERLKEAALDKWFSHLLTTPKNMHLLFEKEFDTVDADVKLN